MRSWSCKIVAIGLTVLLLKSFSPIAHAHDFIPDSVVEFTEVSDVDAVGKVTSRCEMVFPPAVYQRILRLLTPSMDVIENGERVTKYKEPKAENVLRYFGFMTDALIVQDVKGRFDDEAATIHASFSVLGRLARRQGHWVLLSSDALSKFTIHKSSVTGQTVKIEMRSRDNGILGIYRVQLNLPAGTTNIDLREAKKELVFDAPPPKLADHKRPQSRPEMTLETKPQLMSALYKLYGNPKFSELYVARSLFENQTAETLSDYRARFRIDGNSNWTPWSRMDQVFPGQTVVSAFFPIIDSKIMNLKGTTPAQVEVEFEYTRANGDRVTDSESGRTELLGANEALWSNVVADEYSTWYDLFRMAPVVASNFTSATDPVILDAAGMVSKATGGQGNSLNDEAALKFMGTLFNLFRQNISYETTPGGWRNGLIRQHVKYGRDVFRTRSGTCVNLAIAYASVCEAAGLRPYVMLGGTPAMGNHAFAAVKLPQSGEMVFVETTMCGGGTRETSYSFVEARELATKIHREWVADGRLIEVDIRALRDNGITPPELPDLGNHPLADWKIEPPDAIDEVLLPRLLIKIKDVLNAVKLPYQMRTGRNALEFDFKSPAGNQWSVIVQTFEGEEIMAVMSLMPGYVPEDQRKKVASFLAEHNTSFQHGNFELSQGGKIVFRTSTHVSGGELTPGMMQSEFEYHIKTMDFNSPKLRPLLVPESDAVTMPIGELLVGTWRTTVQLPNNGLVVSVTSTLSADGSYDALTTVSNGNAFRDKGRWSYQDNKFSMTDQNGQVTDLKMRVVNRDRIVVHDQGYDIDLVYDRINANN